MHSRKIFFLLIISLLFSLVKNALHTKDEWKSRTIYELLTDRFAKSGEDYKESCDLTNYCHGTFKGIQQHLDYISGMGFNAIWISPIVLNKDGSYHGYHALDLYQINPNYGSANDLKELIRTCHKKDIWVILDAVPNHMAPDVPISSINPFNKDEYYHDYCEIVDENNQEQRENCRLFGLPDLKQEHSFVKEKYLEWIQDIITDYDFDGVRYADVPYVPKWFWKEFSQAANTYTFGVISSKSSKYIADYQNYMDGVGNYPLFYAMKESMCGSSMRKLEWYLLNEHKDYISPKYNVNWLDNHDNPRFLNWCNDKRIFRNALIFYFFYEGIPTFYYGDEQYFNGGSDPNNRENMFGYHYTDSEIYKMMKIANEIRRNYKIYDEDLVQRYVDDYFYAYTRGNVLIAVSNVMNLDRVISYHSFNEGDKLCNKLKDQDCIEVKEGKLNIHMDGEPKIYVKE